MKLNQFTVSVCVEQVDLKQSKQGMAILELAGSTPDGKHTMAFTAFKEKASMFADKMKPGQIWLITGQLSGRRYQDKSGGSRVANGAMIGEAVMLQDVLANNISSNFGDEDIPF